jgi:hypothetical protein
MPDVSDERVISFADGGLDIPERLLLAHARGEVLFINGAGTSRPAGLPDFSGLVLAVYARLDAATHEALITARETANDNGWISPRGLTEQQLAEVNRFRKGDYDVVLVDRR